LFDVKTESIDSGDELNIKYGLIPISANYPWRSGTVFSFFSFSRKDHTASWRLGKFQKVVGEEKKEKVSLWTSCAGYIYVKRTPLDPI
jgi:hypothetical protein